MADPTFEAYQDQMGFGAMEAPMELPQSVPMPTQAAPGGTMAGEQAGLETGLGRYQKYLDALEQRLGRYYEQPQQPTLADRLGLFAMAMGNPEMARDVLRQKAAEDLDRRRRNLELSHSIIGNALRLGDLEARQEESERDFMAEMIRAQAYAYQVSRAGERAGAGRALAGIGKSARELAAEARALAELERLRLAQGDPERQARQDYYNWLLRQTARGPAGEGLTFMSPERARQMAEARYPLPGAVAESGVGMTYPPDTLGGMEGPPGVEGSPPAREDFVDEVP